MRGHRFTIHLPRPLLISEVHFKLMQLVPSSVATVQGNLLRNWDEFGTSHTERIIVWEDDGAASSEAAAKVFQTGPAKINPAVDKEGPSFPEYSCQ